MLSREQMFSLETTLMFAGKDSNTQQAAINGGQ